jgi:hypothetical protein
VPALPAGGHRRRQLVEVQSLRLPAVEDRRVLRSRENPLLTRHDDRPSAPACDAEAPLWLPPRPLHGARPQRVPSALLCIASNVERAWRLPH